MRIVQHRLPLKNIFLFFMIMLVGVTLIACSAPHKQTNKERKVFHITNNQLRFNIAECNDIDDWYLDGYRTGKSYSQYKEKMFSQRRNYCEESTGKKINKKFQKSWENGYKKGRI
ncbi:hypothetical protein EV697_10554 [Bisgaardia hudsonensis]|uniref:Lipoprotein n=1 Tax=Bisgaardia hudsonensis TaxID=109472 RepID=A0A4R2MTU5_9PAST|nr:hypothetical protein [Bisgaardia hudsonensis]QLB13610.1 hypothetical protein A6A11_08330 [Bisgaardia hudsonensis]TCP11942.1 hypothetical protein EV697_10554 [Bisgaardia hudsonensis]